MVIDWPAVSFAALWITGLSLNLAALGMADYQRRQTGKRWREIWAAPVYQIVSNLGWMCFCFGLMGSARTGWERVLWGVLGLGFGAFAGRGGWRRR